jgi:hypothetical protein
MSQGLLQRLSGEVTDDTLPRYYPASPLLNKGSLVYMKPSSPLSGISVFPGHGTVIRNLAWDIAKTIIPAATESSLQSTVVSTLLGGTASIAELTTKKGIHVIISKVNDVQAGNDFLIKHSDDIKNHLVDSGHDFFISMIYKKTRIADTAISGDLYLMQNTVNFSFLFQRDDLSPGAASPSRYLGSLNSLNTNVVGNQIRALGYKGFSGSIPSDRSLLSFANKIGSGGAYASFELNKTASLIIYETYVEDLTISGRTFAQASAAMQAYYNAAFASGGIYFGDSHTDPATLP